MEDNRRRISQELLNEYEEYEDQFLPKGKSGGKKKRNPNSKTSKAARSQAIESAELNRQDQAKDRIRQVINNFPTFENTDTKDTFILLYGHWLNQALQDDSATLLDSDVSEEFIRSGKKAGGQNVNKVNSAVRMTHIPSHISVRNDETRDQIQNRERAHFNLEQRLMRHVSDWRVVCPDSNVLSVENISESIQELQQEGNE